MKGVASQRRAEGVLELKIVNEKGLHARASARFVEVVEQFDAAAEVFKDGMNASGDSIMGLLMLAASKGTTIEVQTSGPEAEQLSAALKALVADKFGEEF
jgi:phosphocarrier protein